MLEEAFTLPGSGGKVRFGYLDGHKEKRLAALKEPSISSAMLIRIIDVDGASPSKKLMNDMSMRDRSALRQEMLRVDAGIDTTVETDCQSCGTRIRTRLEAEPGFYSPEFACKGRVFPRLRRAPLEFLGNTGAAALGPPRIRGGTGAAACF